MSLKKSGLYDKQLAGLKTGPTFDLKPENLSKFPSSGWQAYSLWHGNSLLYVGEGGGSTLPGPGKGIRARMTQHASGERTKSHFCVYVGDRVILPKLTLAEMPLIFNGHPSPTSPTPLTSFMTDRIREWVRAHVTVRFVPATNHEEAVAIEREGRVGHIDNLPELMFPNTSFGSTDLLSSIIDALAEE